MKPWLRPIPFALLAAFGVAHVSRAPVDDTAPSRSAALCSTLARTQKITCRAEDVVWIEGPTGVVGALAGKARAIVRGKDASASDDDHAAGSPDTETLDLLSVDARLSPEGQLLDLVGTAHNLTRSGGADEGLPIVHGTRAAYLVEIDGHPQALQILDFAGHDRRAYDELTRVERIQVRIADLQSTGQLRGVKRTVFTLVPAPRKASLAFRPDGILAFTADERTILIDPDAAAVFDAPDVRVAAEVVPKPPGFGPWMSDRLRAASWFGDEKNQALKAIVFTTLEWVKGQRAALTGDTGAAEAENDLGSIQTAPTGPSTFIDPDTSWPPRPLEPMLKPPLAGEGQWIRLDDDPFITPIPSLQTPFVTTFVRTDPGAQQTRVYVTLWDPRLVALHMQAGTVEPVSATGEAGPGQIPRSPEVMRHVVAGFNGGFQATHGEFGMQADGVLYLPPKPFGATVLEMRDGTTAFAAWPKEAEVPDDVLSFRQNMTFMVQDDRYNPWGRAWWGGVPPGWHDAIHTTRSGLCLTKEGFVAYLFGHDIGPEPLGRAMLAARCEMGMHLDMNPGLAGFEFYNMQPAASFKGLGRPLQPDWEYEGTVKELPDFKFRSRRMTKSMGHIQFPRYIQRDARDFFYLTTRTVLPGAPIPGAEPWRVKGLPQHGFPYATAITTLPLGARRVRVLRVDPRAVERLADGAEDRGSTVVVLGKPAPRGGRGRDAGSAPAEAEKKLWLAGHVFTLDKAGAGTPLATLVASPAQAHGAVGIGDEDGFLHWIEFLPEDAPAADASEEMLKLLASLGCSQRGFVGDLRAFLGGTVDIGGEPVQAAPSGPVVRLGRSTMPAAKELFPDTPIVPQSVWQPLQAQRVKWRPTLAPPEKPAASGSASASAPPPPSPAPAPR